MTAAGSGRVTMASVNDIAKKTGISSDKIYAIKRKVASKVASRL